MSWTKAIIRQYFHFRNIYKELHDLRADLNDIKVHLMTEGKK